MESLDLLYRKYRELNNNLEPNECLKLPSLEEDPSMKVARLILDDQISILLRNMDSFKKEDSDLRVINIEKGMNLSEGR